MKKVFLGGTCNESSWREKIIPLLEIDYFNPVVDDWTPACRAEEVRQRHSCDLCLYVITSEMTGVYAIAEAVQDSNNRPEKTIFCFLKDGFNESQIKSLEAVARLIEGNGAAVRSSLQTAAHYINTFQEKEKKYDPNLIECVVDRPDRGPLQIVREATSYVFDYNEDGDCVCPVANTAHRNWLLAQGSFRVYREADQPEKEFTDEEEAWMNTWLNTGPDRFLSFVNANTAEFIKCRHNLKRIAYEKWKNLLPKFETCPFMEDGSGCVPRKIMDPDEVPVPEESDNSILDPDIDVEEFKAKIKYLKRSNYDAFVDTNEIFFLNTSDEIEEIAIEKWKRFYKEPWPFEVLDEDLNRGTVTDEGIGNE